MKFVTFLSVLALLPLVRGVDNLNCTAETACSCNTKLGVMSLADQTFNNGESFIEVYSNQDGNTYRFYPCGVDTSWGGDCAKGATTCQYSSNEQVYYSLGAIDSYSITEVSTDEKNQFITFFYQGGTDQRSSTVTVFCDASVKDDVLTFIDEYPQLEYNLELVTSKICPGAPAPSTGEPVVPALFILVILVLFLAIVTYLVVGVLLMVFWKGARGFEIIPNLAFWKDLPFLFKDGVLFSFSYIPAARAHIGGDKSYTALK